LPLASRPDGPALPRLLLPLVADQIGGREEEGDLGPRVLGESDPCTLFASMLFANSFRMVPSAALAGFVAPITSRLRATAFSPSSTCTMTGPLVMYCTRLLKNGRSRCTA